MSSFMDGGGLTPQPLEVTQTPLHLLVCFVFFLVNIEGLLHVHLSLHRYANPSLPLQITPCQLCQPWFLKLPHICPQHFLFLCNCPGSVSLPDLSQKAEKRHPGSTPRCFFLKPLQQLPNLVWLVSAFVSQSPPHILSPSFSFSVLLCVPRN